VKVPWSGHNLEWKTLGVTWSGALLGVEDTGSNLEWSTTWKADEVCICSALTLIQEKLEVSIEGCI
jgi:hypothetical protein